MPLRNDVRQETQRLKTDSGLIAPPLVSIVRINSLIFTFTEQHDGINASMWICSYFVLIFRLYAASSCEIWDYTGGDAAEIIVSVNMKLR